MATRSGKKPFIVDVTELRAKGSAPFHHEVPSAAWDQDLFPNPIRVEATLLQAGGEFWVEGEVATEAKLECARCAGDFSEPMRVGFKEEVFPGGGEGLGPSEVDLEPVIRDSLLLAVPMQPICREDCPGLCPRCGKLQDLCSCPPEAEPRWEVLLEATTREP